MTRSVLVLGSTGSVGTQALQVIEANPGRFRVPGLAAGGSDPAALAAQALTTGAEVVAVTRSSAMEDVQLACYAEAQRRGYATGSFRLPRILAGPDAVQRLIEQCPADVVLNGITGSQGLPATLAALDTGSTLALANKESLIAGGPLVQRAAAPGQLVPVDSEHSALAQCLRGGAASEVATLVLTASGGPFRGWTREQLEQVSLEQALAHPTWSMGQVITINSATMVNKGLEIIEAHLLFGVDYEHIQAVVHPQSIVHSMVTFTDGATLAQASPPDMRLPIALGLSWPERVPDAAPACDFGLPEGPTSWEFQPVDHQAFPAIELAKSAGRAGGCLPAVFNAANEAALAAFVDGRLSFTGIVDTVADVLADADQWRHAPSQVADVHAAQEWARAHAGQRLG